MPRNVDNVNLETGTGNMNRETEGSEFLENKFVEDLYGSWYSTGWLWFWVVAIFSATTYGATQGIAL
jgi:hypothetical protein